MAGRIDTRLAELGLALPKPARPAANYVPFVQAGSLVFISGQGPVGPDGQIAYRGKLGQDLGLEEGRAAARLCALNILAQIKEACGGDLDRVTRIAMLGGFVNAAPAFTEHPEVINGASDLLVEVLGDRGRHARFAVGAGSLPFDIAVEIDAIAEIASA